MTLASIATRIDSVAELLGQVVPADVMVTPETPNRIHVGRPGEKDYLLQFTDVDRLIEVVLPEDGQRLGILEPVDVLVMIRRFYQTPAPAPEPDVDQAAWDADNRMFGREDAEPEAATPVEDWFTPTAPVVESVAIDPTSANWAPAIALTAALDSADDDDEAHTV